MAAVEEAFVEAAVGTEEARGVVEVMVVSVMVDMVVVMVVVVVLRVSVATARISLADAHAKQVLGRVNMSVTSEEEHALE